MQSSAASLPIVVLLAACIGGPLACGGDEVPEAARASLRTLEQGKLVGFESEYETHAWQGIPFAAPPVGPLRWRAPQPAAPWQGEFAALTSGEACVQLASQSPGKVRGSEDCLFLDVYAPRFAADAVPQGSARLPVMVWIHGGGNSLGDATIYDGSRLAADGPVIVVSIQYRLGVLGWFTHRALRASAQGPEDASGNFGTLDQIRALEWVRDNIAAFGGDAGNVTIFGESAGGVDVQALLVSPRARGLFHRALSQSGRLTTMTHAEGENCIDAAQPGSTGSACEVVAAHLVEDGRAVDRAAAKALAATLPDAEVEALLRGKGPKELLAIYKDELGGMYAATQLYRDGTVLSALPPEVALATPGEHNAVPTLLGSNREETKLFALMTSPYVDRFLGIPVGLENEGAFDLSGEYGALFWRSNGVDLPAQALSASGRSDVFGYRFDWDEEGELMWIDLAALLGASHAVEIPFVFGFTDFGRFTDNFYPNHESAVTLSRQMRSYWTHFAYTGSPGRGRDGSLPEWRPWTATPDAPKYLVLDTPAGGGLRMESEVIPVPELLTRMAGDSRFDGDEVRCEILREIERFSRLEIRPGYATFGGGVCAAVPLDPILPLKIF